MMQGRDWLSGAIGLLLVALGGIPLLSQYGVIEFALPFSLSLSIAGWILAIAGLYLVANSFIEITNSNVIGKFSFFTAAIIATLGILNVLGQFGIVEGFFAITWLNDIIFNVLFVILGFFLTIATFAMEL